MLILNHCMPCLPLRLAPSVILIFGQLPRSFRTHMLDAPWLLPDRLAAGDIVLFDLRTIHSTTVNQMNRFRISADLRWCLKPNRPNFGLTAPSRAVLDVQMPM